MQAEPVTRIRRKHVSVLMGVGWNVRWCVLQSQNVSLRLHEMTWLHQVGGLVGVSGKLRM